MTAFGKSVICFAIIGLAALPVPVRALVIAGPMPSPVNGHLYYLLAASDWFAAEREARALGGHLATIRSDAENAWVYAMFGTFGGTPRHLWIGLFDEGRDSFEWASGEPVRFTHWCPTQPDHAGGREHYGHLIAPEYCAWGGWWNDLDGRWIATEGFPMNGVVEVVLIAAPTFGPPGNWPSSTARGSW